MLFIESGIWRIGPLQQQQLCWNILYSASSSVKVGKKGEEEAAAGRRRLGLRRRQLDGEEQEEEEEVAGKKEPKPPTRMVMGIAFLT